MTNRYPKIALKAALFLTGNHATREPFSVPASRHDGRLTGQERLHIYNTFCNCDNAALPGPSAGLLSDQSFVAQQSKKSIDIH